MKQSSSPIASPLRSASKQRGSALILAIVTIIMMVMLGTAYLQMARMDRRTAAAVDTRSNVSDASILRYIGQILAGDVPQTLDDTDIEPHDYPWSDAATPWTVDDRFAPITVPGPVPGANDLPAREPRASSGLVDSAGRTQAQGGTLDDTWLASIRPNMSTRWDHITNLSGVFVDLNPATFLVNPGPFVGTYPSQYLSTANNNVNSGDTDVVPAAAMGVLSAADLGRFADADGDNIADSRWTWAPLPSDGGRAYVMAVRIIDNSALVDTNTWNETFAAADPPRWLWPGELDLNRPINVLTTAAGTGTLTGGTITTDRGVTGATRDDRLFNWLNASAVPFNVGSANNLADWDSIGTPLEKAEIASPGTGVAGGEDLTNPSATYKRYNHVQNELELRWRNGLNRSSDNVTADPATDLESLDTAFFRTAAVENVFTDSPYGASIANFFDNEPRKWLTTISGSADYGRINLNTASTDDISKAFEDAIGVSPVNQPALFGNGGWSTNEEFGDQMAALLADQRDKGDDGELTQVGDMYGMEYLPFISEVYFQARFNNVTVTPGTPHQAVWSTRGDFAVAIEIVNPWPWPIKMADVEMDLWDGTTTLNLGNLKTILNNASITRLEANEAINLVRLDPSGPAANAELPNAGVADITPGSRVVVLPSTTNWINDTGTARVKADLLLSAKSDTGRVAYQAFGTEGFPAGLTDTYSGAAPAPTLTAPGFMQTYGQTTGTTYSVMTVDSRHDSSLFGAAPPADLGELAQQTVAVAVTAPAVALNTRVNDVSPESHTGNKYFALVKATTFDNRVDPTIGQWTIGNGGQIYRTGDLLRTIAVGPRVVGGLTQTVGQVWKQLATAAGGSYELVNAQIALNDPGRVINSALPAGPASGLSHAAYYLSRFTNLVVNNGNGGLIAGRPNINTMDVRLLEAALPTATPGASTAIANAIVARRAADGIAVIGELEADTAVMNLATTPLGNTEVLDFNEDEEPLGPNLATNATEDGVSGDAEEHTKIISYLNQTVSTRSDIFTAYVLVRAYPADDFTNGGTAPGYLDEFRLIAVFDRSRVSESGFPKLLAVKKFVD